MFGRRKLVGIFGPAFPDSALALQNFVSRNSAAARHTVKTPKAFPDSALALQNFVQCLQKILNAV